VTGNRRLLRIIAAGLAAMIGALVLAAVLALPADHEGLGPLAAAGIAEAGASNPVTAVLLNFRAYDTWLEVGVLLLAALGVLTIVRTIEVSSPDPHRDETRLLPAAARAVAMLGVIVAGYLLWRGTFAAGGAFQAGAVLGASLVLLRVAGIRTLDRLRPGTLLAALTIAFVAFGGAAALTAIGGGPMLTYRDEPAAVGIVLLELAIGASTAVTLALLFSLAGARR
jgi:multisubunit Na+/H+ antiporter MnhB subunit